MNTQPARRLPEEPSRGSDAPDAEDSCYHCGLPLDPNLDAHTEILGRQRHFCCHGCRAVARSIVDAGLEALSDYMRGDTVVIDVELAIAAGAATVWGCDLTDGYVRINADYTT